MYNYPYHIGDETYFQNMPSRFSYYDTETKETDRYKRYKIITDFIHQLNFIPSENNLGLEYEQAFYCRWEEVGLIIRIRTNMFITLVVDGEGIYNAFFNKDAMLVAFAKHLGVTKKQFEREMKLTNLLN